MKCKLCLYIIINTVTYRHELHVFRYIYNITGLNMPRVLLLITALKLYLRTLAQLTKNPKNKSYASKQYCYMYIRLIYLEVKPSPSFDTLKRKHLKNYLRYQFRYKI